VASLGSTLPQSKSSSSPGVSQTNALEATSTLFGGDGNTACWLQDWRFSDSSFVSASTAHAITTVGVAGYATVANAGILRSSRFHSQSFGAHTAIQLVCEVIAKAPGSSNVRVEGYSIVKMPLGVPHYRGGPRNKFVRHPVSSKKTTSQNTRRPE
jgi:hypothetical protein